MVFSLNHLIIRNYKIYIANEFKSFDFDIRDVYDKLVKIYSSNDYELPLVITHSIKILEMGMVSNKPVQITEAYNSIMNYELLSNK